ncbi:MAG: SDR family NAD(P)-dependent oxidoreductase [Acidobacteria bacterium]|nr:SDR family NAD(P)-dependent oxidoreductase [Acidobacteriota bacterium]
MPKTPSKPLTGQVAVVAGATRGVGRGIAVMLGEAGATVYCTGRSVRGKLASGRKRPETINETAALVTAQGGKGIAVRVDHTVEPQVARLFARVRREEGRLDLLVNDVWGGDALMEWGVPFWKLDMKKGRTMLRRAIWAHVLTSRYGVPLMVERRTGLVVEVTDGDFLGWRGNLFYDLTKVGAIRLAYSMASDLRDTGVSAVAVTPGFLRSEAMLDRFGVTEENWREHVKKDPHFAESETPWFVGRAVAALAADPNVRAKSGRVFASWTLAREYGFKDRDGRQPDWGRYMDGVVQAILDRGGPKESGERFLLLVRYFWAHLEPEMHDEARRIGDLLDIHFLRP